MKIETLHINMKVRHPQHGLGTVKAVSEHTAEIQFEIGLRTIAPETSELQPAQAQVEVSGLEIPLAQFVEQTAQAIVRELGLEKSDSIVEELGSRWHNGRMILYPADTALQPKEVPLEAFFHKIVMMRNNLRVLEQKINTNGKLSEADKFDLHQYITRCYGSMTTFNLLFKDKQDQFGSNET